MKAAAASNRTLATTLCRACHAHCNLIVEMEQGVARKIYGNKNDPISRGYSCIRGRELASYERAPTRLLHAQRRTKDDRFESISSADAIAEIAAKLKAIVAEHGPRSVAGYAGTFCTINMLSHGFMTSFFDALGSAMVFTSTAIDQPGKFIANALHGPWLGGSQRLTDDVESVLMIGHNPLVSVAGCFGWAPAHNLLEAKKRGVKIIVCDPRRTETAKHADIFLQVRPGEDFTVLAGLIHIILREELYDKAFVEAEAKGLQLLRDAVGPFTPEYVAARTGVRAADLIATARTHGAARKGVVFCGTGANMAPYPTLTEYLGRILVTLCGHHPRAGEALPNPGVLIDTGSPIAATPGPVPAFGFGEKLRLHGLTNTAGGMPTAILPDEILLPGEGQVRALFVVGGNPATVFPDQIKTLQALKSLELLVVVDPHLSRTAKLADYVIAPKLSLESTGVAAAWEAAGMWGSVWGYDLPWQHYSPALVEPPPGSDVIDDWAFFYELGRQMQLQLKVKPVSVLADPQRQNEAAVAVDMQHKPTTAEAWSMLFRHSPVPFEQVMEKAVGGHVFDLPKKYVGDKPAGWTGRFDLANESMLAQLRQATREDRLDTTPQRAFLLTSRRLQDIYNSTWHEHAPLQRKWKYNPAFMNTDDLASMGLSAGDIIEIESDRGRILAIVQPEADLKPGCVSMSHGWGTLPDEPDDPAAFGSNTGRLCSTDTDCDPMVWMARQSAIPVSVRRHRA